jgi:hypothetical protein
LEAGIILKPPFQGRQQFNPYPTEDEGKDQPDHKGADANHQGH